MWLFGRATKSEIKAIKKQGWEVNDVDLDHFDKCLDPNAEADADCPEPTGKFIAVFIDNDIFAQLTKWHNEERAITERDRKVELDGLRRMKVDEVFENVNLPVIVTDADAWEADGPDRLIRTFYYENDNPEDDNLCASFIVTFKHNTDKVIDSYANY